MRSVFRSLSIILALAVSVFLSHPVLAGANVELLKEEQVTSGATLKTFIQQNGNGPLKIYVLTVDLRNPYIQLRTLLGNDNESFSGILTVREMAERAGAVAAINGDFFNMSEGRPLGVLVRDEKILSSPMQRSDHYSFAMLRDGTPLIDLLRFTGTVSAPEGLSFYSLAGINKSSYWAVVDGQSVNSDVYALHMYTPAWGAVSRGAAPGQSDIVELVVSGGLVQEIRQGLPGVAIPKYGYVLRGHGTAAAFLLDNFHVGDPVTVNYQIEPIDKNILSAVGGQALLVDNGRRVDRFSQNIKGNAARSAVGFTQDGSRLCLAAVEQSTGSRGMSQEELADFMVERLGLWRALNLDGGGSTSLAVRPLGDFKPVLANTPAKGSERKVPDALGIFSTAPPGTLAGLVMRGPLEVVAGLPYRYRAGAYDNYFNPYIINADDIAWKVEEGNGSFTGDTLTASSGGKLTVTAEAGGVTGKLDVRALGIEDMEELIAAPDRITVVPGGQVQINVKLRGKDGRFWPVEGQYVTWSGQADMGEIINGVFNAGQEVTAGTIVARFGGLEVSVPVEVANPGQEFLWIGPEGGDFKQGDFDVRVPAGMFLTQTPVRVEAYLAPDDLPEGYAFISGFALRPAASNAATAYCLVKSMPAGQNNGSVVFLRRGANGRWIVQPTVGSGNEPVISRVYGMGEIVVAVREGTAAEPPDVVNHWSRPAVSTLMMRDMVHGFPDGTYRPEENVTRAQFASMLSNAFGWEDSMQKTLSFSDRIPAWAEPGIRAAVAQGVVAGYPDGRFRPDKSITRAEMASMIERALRLQDRDAPVFSDGKSIPKWAVPAVSRAAAAGLMVGDRGIFRPLSTATRGETAALITKALEYYTRW
ncbi:MAG: phosphodiester glycosidase family protein [Bacillota bacterium]